MSDSGTGYWKPEVPALPADLVHGAMLIFTPEEIKIGRTAGRLRLQLDHVLVELSALYEGEAVWLVGETHDVTGFPTGRTQILVYASAVPDALERGRATSGGRPA